MYLLNDKGLFHNGQRVPRMLHYQECPDGLHQALLDLLCDYFKNDLEPERRALAIYRKSPDLLLTRFVHAETSCISDEELGELVTTVLLRAHDEREMHVEVISGCRRDTLRLQ